MWPHHNYWLSGIIHHNSGKSIAAAYKVTRFLYNNAPPKPLTPYWVISQTAEMAGGVNGRHLMHFIHPNHIQDIVWHSRARKQPSAIVLKRHENGNAWIIEFKSFEADRKRLQGFSLGGLWIDELAPYEIVMEAWARCREFDYPGSKLYTLTPIVDGSKGYDALELERLYRDGAPDWKFYRLNAKLNTALAPGFLDRFLASEVEQLRETRTTGAFASLTGAVFPSFGDPHIIPPFPIPEDWHRFRGIDFGWSDETAVVWFARDDRGTYYCINEYVQHKQLMEDHAKAILDVPFPADAPSYVDSAAAQEKHELAKYGIKVQNAKKDILPGIGCIQRLLREKRLFFFNSCTNTIRQLRTYHWHGTLKDKVANQVDHCVDAVRYALYTDVRSYREPAPVAAIPPSTPALTKEMFWGLSPR